MIIQSGVNEGALLAALPSVFSSSLTWVSELAQNARRARATTVKFFLVPDEEEAGAFNVEVVDDGCGIEDPSVLIGLGTSGWDDVMKMMETPFGMGFAAAIMAASSVEVHSKFGMVRLTAEDLLTQRPVTVHTEFRREVGTYVRLHFGKETPAGIIGVAQEIEKRLDAFPITVLVNDDSLRSSRRYLASPGALSVSREFFHHDMRITVDLNPIAFFMASRNHYGRNVSVYVQGIRTDECISTIFAISRVELGDSYIARFPDRSRIVDFETSVAPRIKSAIQSVVDTLLPETVPLVMREGVAARAEFVRGLHLIGLVPPLALEKLGVPGSMFSEITTNTERPSEHAHSYELEPCPSSHFVHVFGNDDIPLCGDLGSLCDAYGFLHGFVMAVLAERGVKLVSNRMSAESRTHAAIESICARTYKLLGLQLPADEGQCDEDDEACAAASLGANFELDADEDADRGKVATCGNLTVQLGSTYVLRESVGMQGCGQRFIFTNEARVIFAREGLPDAVTVLSKPRVLPLCRTNDTGGCSDEHGSHDVVILIPSKLRIEAALRDTPQRDIKDMLSTAVWIAGDFKDGDEHVDHRMHDNDTTSIFLRLASELMLSTSETVRDALRRSDELAAIFADDDVEHELVIRKGKGNSMDGLTVRYTRK